MGPEPAAGLPPEYTPAPPPTATETAQTPGQTRIYYPPQPGGEDGQPARLRQELADIRHETAAVRFQLALLYDHNEEPPPAEAAPGNPHAQLAAARREYARLLDTMADYQQTEHQDNDSPATLSAANTQRAAADYHQTAADRWWPGKPN